MVSTLPQNKADAVPPVGMAMADLDHSITDLDKVLGELVVRLQPLVRPPEPECPFEKGDDSDLAGVPLALELRRRSITLDRLVAASRNLLARLGV